MNDTLDLRPLSTDPLRDALLESRQRWRDFVAIAADVAFETDAAGNFVFLSPDLIVDWPASELLGQASERLLPDSGGAPCFNPFRSAQRLRNRRVWLKRADGRLCWMSISVAPLTDESGRMIGARGTGRDVTDLEGIEAAMARTLRRSELIDHIVWHISSEVMAPRMMAKALAAITGTLGGQGAMIVDGRPQDAPLQQTPSGPPDLVYDVGGDVPGLRECASARLAAGVAGPMTLIGPAGHVGILCATPTRFGGCPGLLLWRLPGHRDWTAEDLSLLGGTAGAIRIVLEHAAIQREMARQARTDPLTGLQNRRAFTEDMARRIDRLDRDGQPGTLLYVDLDNFKMLNDRHGHEAGDEGLRVAATLLRAATRPGDLLARLGGDEFAVWMDGMDDLAAAERAEQLCRQAPSALARVSDRPPMPSLSVGIVTRWPGSGAEGDTLLRRADKAMYLVKQSGRGSWRVWRGEEDDGF